MTLLPDPPPPLKKPCIWCAEYGISGCHPGSIPLTEEATIVLLIIGESVNAVTRHIVDGQVQRGRVERNPQCCCVPGNSATRSRNRPCICRLKNNPNTRKQMRPITNQGAALTKMAKTSPPTTTTITVTIIFRANCIIIIILLLILILRSINLLLLL